MSTCHKGQRKLRTTIFDINQWTLYNFSGISHHKQDLNKLLYIYNRNNTVHKNNHGNFIRLRKTLSSTARFKSDPSGSVINLSKHYFTTYEYQVLNKNFNFFITPGYFNKNQLKTDLTQFTRMIKLRAHFGVNESYDPNAEENIFKNN